MPRTVSALPAEPSCTIEACSFQLGETARGEPPRRAAVDLDARSQEVQLGVAGVRGDALIQLGELVAQVRAGRRPPRGQRQRERTCERDGGRAGTHRKRRGLRDP